MNVGIITASDKGYLGEREDRSGARIAEIMEAQGYTVRKKVILPDDQQMLQDEMIAMCNDDIQLILTTGGTGFSKRDVTPEATLAVSGRVAPGNKGSERAGSAGNSHGNPAIFTDDHRAGDAVESSSGYPWRDIDRQSAGQSEGCG